MISSGMSPFIYMIIVTSVYVLNWGLDAICLTLQAIHAAAGQIKCTRSEASTLNWGQSTTWIFLAANFFKKYSSVLKYL